MVSDWSASLAETPDLYDTGWRAFPQVSTSVTMGTQSDVSFDIILLQRRIENTLLWGARVRRTVDYTGTANSATVQVANLPQGYMSFAPDVVSMPIQANVWDGNPVSANTTSVTVLSFTIREYPGSNPDFTFTSTHTGQALVATNQWVTTVCGGFALCTQAWPDTLPGTATTV